MREGHVAGAERGEVPELPQVVIDHVAALHAHQRGNLVLACRAAHVGGSRREDEIVRMRADGFTHGVDLIVGALERGGTDDVARNPDRKEQRIEPAFLHARDVDVAVGMALAEVEFGIEHQPLSGVGVRVHHDRLLVNARGLRLRQNDDGQRKDGGNGKRKAQESSHARNITAATEDEGPSTKNQGPRTSSRPPPTET